MQNFSVDLRSFHKQYLYPNSLNYDEYFSDYIKFVESFIKNNKENLKDQKTFNSKDLVNKASYLMK